MEMIRATILERGIDDTLWSEIVLAINHIKNLWPTWALENSISLIEMQNQISSDLYYLHIFGLNLYVFFYKKEKSLKLTKWEACALQGTLVRFSYTIYKDYIEDQNKVIRVKNLRIFEDITPKTITSLPDFERKPTFDGV